MTEKNNEKKPTRDPEVYRDVLRYDFSREELAEIAQITANAISEKSRLDGELKSISTQYKADIAKAEATYAKGAEQLRNKYEMRLTECSRFYNTENYNVTEMRNDTEEILRVRKMTAEEKQRIV